MSDRELIGGSGCVRVRLVIAGVSIMLVAGCGATPRPPASTAPSATLDDASGIEDAMFDSAKVRFVDEVFASCEQAARPRLPNCVPETLLYALDESGQAARLCEDEEKDLLRCVLWASLTYDLARQARVDKPDIDRDNPNSALRATVKAIHKASYDACFQRDPSKAENCVAEELQDRFALTTAQKAVCIGKPVPIERVKCTFRLFLVRMLENGLARVKERQLEKA